MHACEKILNKNLALGIHAYTAVLAVPYVKQN
jgi:hypothetical protein